MKLLPASLAAMVLVGGLTSGALAAEARRTYIVQLSAEPAASYDGGVAGYAATQPAPGARFSARALPVRRYLRYLDAQQRSVAALVANAPIVARYNTVYNGFAARLTDAEVAALRASPQVVAVHVDEKRQLETISTPAFLGLIGPGGVWTNTVNGIPLLGEDVVIGIVDGGVWPENPAYADRVDANGRPVFSGGTLAYDPAPVTFSGTCVGGEGFTPAVHCNNKLIGAQFFNAGFLASGLPKNWSEFYSPRDSVGGALAHGGHGSHTSSTAGGNAGVEAIVSGVDMGQATGIAPRARIAAYKVCWSYDDATATDGTGSRNSCWTSDSVSAIDRAVSDGVQVINYSISGSQTSVNDPVEQAFLRAATANVFVAASAGNSGPGVAVAHVSPWLTTVAASTHDRLLAADVTLGNGTTYTGASINTTALPQTPLIRAEDAGLPGADATAVRLCFLPSQLDPSKVRRQGRHLYPRHERPRRQERGRKSGRRCRDDPGRQRRRAGGRRACRPVGPRQQRRRRGDQGLRRIGKRADGRHRHLLQRPQARADHGRLLVARAEPGGCEHPQARPDGARRRHHCRGVAGADDGRARRRRRGHR